MSATGGTWPEQNAVDAWLTKHGIKVDFEVAMELKNAVTAYRITVQEERDRLKSVAPLPELQTLSGETPRTDEACKENGCPTSLVPADFARQLERELARLERGACCPDERVCEKAPVSTSGTRDMEPMFNAVREWMHARAFAEQTAIIDAERKIVSAYAVLQGHAPLSARQERT